MDYWIRLDILHESTKKKKKEGERVRERTGQKKTSGYRQIEWWTARFLWINIWQMKNSLKKKLNKYFFSENASLLSAIFFYFLKILVIIPVTLFLISFYLFSFFYLYLNSLFLSIFILHSSISFRFFILFFRIFYFVTIHI